jgi:hypothetical protein
MPKFIRSESLHRLNGKEFTMKSISILALAAALALTPAGAFAQDASVSAGADATASAATSALDTSAEANASASASASGALSLDDLIGDIGNDDWTADVEAATAAGADANITIVEVASLEGSANVDAVTDATASNGDRIAALQAAVGANAAIQAKLVASGHDTDDVVAVKTDGAGAIWVYVDEAE